MRCTFESSMLWASWDYNSSSRGSYGGGVLWAIRPKEPASEGGRYNGEDPRAKSARGAPGYNCKERLKGKGARGLAGWAEARPLQLRRTG